MKIALVGNCQVDGIEYMLKRALPNHEYRRLPHLATFYGEFTEEQIAETHAWADVVFFHHKHDGVQDYPTKQPKIPLSVWYQSGPFMMHTPENWWEVIREYAGRHGNHVAAEWAIQEDLSYELRWDSCLKKMMEKEEDECVPPALRMSDMMVEGRVYQMQLTCNHPTSAVFREWALRICAFLGEHPHSDACGWLEALTNPNLAGLPCEESATSGAVRHLGLHWGGRPEDDDSGRLIVKERLA